MIPAEIKAISYFTNLLLFSAFFGLGLGCILWKRNVPPYLMTVGLVLIFVLVTAMSGITIYDTHGELHYWLQQEAARFQPLFQIPLVAAAFSVFLVSAIPFVTMGCTLSREMQKHERLSAYAYDLLGSFLGTVAFALVSYLGCPPWVLITLTAFTWAFVFCPPGNVRLAQSIAGLLFLYFAVQPYSWCWSPYYFVQYNVAPSRITVWVNSSFHQEAIDFKTEQPEAQKMAEQMTKKFGLPYQIYQEISQRPNAAKSSDPGSRLGKRREHCANQWRAQNHRGGDRPANRANRSRIQPAAPVSKSGRAAGN